MEYLNKVHIRGVVGNSALHKLNGKDLIRFSVMTDYAYITPNGEVVIDTTWYPVLAIGADNMPDFSELKKGKWVEVEGRLRNVKYTKSDGTSLSTFEICANSVKLL